MEYDQDKVDEMVLALLSLAMFEEDQYGVRAWKGHDWVAMDRLHAKGYISDPQEQGQIGRGDRERRPAMPRAVRETLREEKTGSASAVGFAATVAEPFRSGKRVRARITTRQAPFRKGRGTPCGCASLRGVDRPCPRP
jgi:hypothetical protein